MTFKKNLKLNPGLSEKEAKEKLEKFGPNIFWKKRGFDWLRFTREEVFTLFNFILLVVFLISFFGGGKRIESYLILVFLLVSIFLSLFSELNFHRLYSKLEKFLQKKVLVKRDGKLKFILAEFLVPGDIIYLRSGEKVPADCQIIKSFNAFFDEQVFSGESLPVERKVGDLILAGTEISEGEVEAEVRSTGSQTRFSKIGKLAVQTAKKSAYQKELEIFAKNLIKIVAIFFSFLFIFHLIFKPYETREILAFSLILGISIIPEFFPPITVLTLAIFTKHFAKKGNIIKRLTAIEDLGVIDILCVDKTGTLTTNKLKLEKIDSDDREKFLTYSLSLDLGFSQKYLSDFGEAMEKVIDQNLKEKIEKIQLINRRLFNPKLRISQGILKIEDKKILVIAGAPENVLAFSKFSNSDEENLWLEKLKDYSNKGFRVYSLSFKEIEKEEFIEKGKKISDLNFLGMATFIDSIKENVKETLLKAEELGVDVKILTGDRPEVAKNVACEIGLIEENEKIFSEEELLKMSDEEFQKTVEKFNVFARVTPETKYKIVKVLEKKYQVGYLGEGINDLPVIKLANVGLVVDTAVDAAKEVADVILLQRDLRVIIDGITLGRQAFFNIIKFLRHTMSDNFGDFFSIGFLSFFLPFLPLTPVQIIATDFLTDLPLFAVASDNVLFQEIRKPAHYRMKELFLFLVSLGIVAAIFISLIFLIFQNKPAEFLRTLIFLQTTLSGILVFYSIRTNEWFFKSRPSNLMHLSIFISLFLTFIFIYSPLGSWFGFTILPINIIIFLCLFNLLFILVNDLIKKFCLKILKK